MSTQSRNVRGVIDAQYDIDGFQAVDSATRAGWTDKPVQTGLGMGLNPSLVKTFFYDEFEDANGEYPYQDETNIVGNGVQQGNIITDTGLKHLQHQMQAMKSDNNILTYFQKMADDVGLTIFGFNVPPPSATNVTGVGDGVGVYKQNNIKLGGMRGIEYHQHTLSEWPSSGLTAERLHYSGEISIGSTS